MSCPPKSVFKSKNTTSPVPEDLTPRPPPSPHRLSPRLLPQHPSPLPQVRTDYDLALPQRGFTFGQLGRLHLPGHPPPKPDLMAGGPVPSHRFLMFKMADLQVPP